MQNSERTQTGKDMKTPVISVVRQLPKLGKKKRKTEPYKEPFPEEISQA